MERLSLIQAADIISRHDPFFCSRPTGSSGATFSVIKNLGYLQIDTISVIRRAHEHILWTRNSDFTPEDIDKLQSPDRRIFEYWGHAAAYLPLEDYRYCLPRMERIKREGFEWFKREEKVIGEILARIKAEGPLSARDFEKDSSRKSGPWWDWKPAKIALEHLFMEGTLMVAGRKNFQKIYDLTERVLPSSANTKYPSPEESADYLIDRTLTRLGLFSELDVTYLRKDGISGVKDRLSGRCGPGGDLVPLALEGVKRRYYTSPDLLSSAAPGFGASYPNGFRPSGEVSRAVPFCPENRTPVLRFLSPFDPLVINRKRLTEVFGFAYQFECYVPKEKRKFGYFALPIFYCGGFIGRIDCKAERKAGRLMVNALAFDGLGGDNAAGSEKENLRSRAFPSEKDFLTELNRFAWFNGCGDIEFSHQSKTALEQAFSL